MFGNFISKLTLCTIPMTKTYKLRSELFLLFIIECNYFKNESLVIILWGKKCVFKKLQLYGTKERRSYFADIQADIEKSYEFRMPFFPVF